MEGGSSSGFTKSLSPSSEETFQPNPGHMQADSSWKYERLAGTGLGFFPSQEEAGFS